MLNGPISAHAEPWHEPHRCKQNAISIHLLLFSFFLLFFLSFFFSGVVVLAVFVLLSIVVFWCMCVSAHGSVWGWGVPVTFLLSMSTFSPFFTASSVCQRTFHIFHLYFYSLIVFRITPSYVSLLPETGTRIDPNNNKRYGECCQTKKSFIFITCMIGGTFYSQARQWLWDQLVSFML